MSVSNDFESLNSGAIQAQFSAELSASAKLHLHQSIDSTNSCLLQGSHTAVPEVCATELQMHGRGRRGHTWHTPVRGVTFSMKLTVPVQLAEIGGASLVCGVSVCEALHSFGVVTAAVKWPNDILVGQAKLAGILVEVAAHSKSSTTLVVGIGVNYCAGDEKQSIDRAIVDLNQLCDGSPPDRNELIGRICNQVYSDLTSSLPLSSRFVERWNDHDALAGQQVTVVQQAGNKVFESFTGRVSGIDQRGHLLLETADGMRAFSSAEVTIKKSEKCLNETARTPVAGGPE